VACLGLVAFWTMAHGTSVTGVFDAMYPFRIEAGRVMAASNRDSAHLRLWVLVACWVVSGGVVIMGLATRALVTRRLRSAATWGLVATVVFDIVSIALGGSYWNHYLIQLVVPIAVLSGLLVAMRQPAARAVVAAVALAAGIALIVHVAVPRSTTASSVGDAIGVVAGPQDTIVTTWGHADVTLASGLRSPYPYLWSLPARTLDPRLTKLTALLSGPRAPTWFVTWRGVSRWKFHGGGPIAARALAEHYYAVTKVNGHTIYLHRGVRRAVPDLPPHSADLSGSSSTFSTTRPLKEAP
jgi:hypothetical protein